LAQLGSPFKSEDFYGLSQKSGNDISENGIDENVHWFANPETETLNWPRRESPFDYNGSGSKAHKPQLLYEKDHLRLF